MKISTIMCNASSKDKNTPFKWQIHDLKMLFYEMPFSAINHCELCRSHAQHDDTFKSHFQNHVQCYEPEKFILQLLPTAKSINGTWSNLQFLSILINFLKEFSLRIWMTNHSKV